ncbi:MAG TPA: zinc ribbon domain-containing protein [Acidobacteriota bacterium]|nr:zinc ribbon domain-containing protein [Acidobacteriota bacterium]
MRFCNRCRRLTAGQPMFCNHCGASYDVKLCPRRHVNPRTARVCSTCGSPDLSLPAPALPVWLKAGIWLVSWLPLVVLGLLSLLLFAGVLEVVLTNRQVQARLLILLILFGLLTYAYSRMPRIVQRMIRSSWLKARRALSKRRQDQ